MAKNKVTFGLRNVHIAFETTPPEGQTGPTYEAPVAIPGAVRFTPTAAGQDYSFYADDGIYFAATTNDGETAELEMALIPDEITAKMLGWLIDDNGVLVEVADGIPVPFALMGEVQGDKKPRKFVRYRCQAARTAKELATKGDTMAVATDIMSLTITPVEITIDSTVHRVVKGSIELKDDKSNQAAFDGWYTQVTLPVITPVTP